MIFNTIQTGGKRVEVLPLESLSCRAVVRYRLDFDREPFLPENLKAQLREQKRISAQIKLRDIISQIDAQWHDEEAIVLAL